MVNQRQQLADVPTAFALSKAELGLQDKELLWVARYDYLKSKGYQLDNRYAPDWVPSWTTERLDAYVDLRQGKNEHRWFVNHEDSVVDHPARSAVKDAVRISDGRQVIVKVSVAGNAEPDILRYLSTERASHDPRNPAQRVLDEFPVAEDDPLYSTGDSPAMYIILPLARDWRHPPLVLASEALSFIQQLLDGLCFLHEHNIAHRDIREDNIMMDPTTLFPDGMHPKNNLAITSPWMFPEPRQARERADADVRYFFIDYGSSVMFPSHAAREKVPAIQCQLYAPEMATADMTAVDLTRYYDPFKADVFALGLMLDMYFWKVLPELQSVWEAMVVEDPDKRPSAAESRQLFVDLKSRLPRGAHLRRVPNVRLVDFGGGWPMRSVVKERLQHRAKYFKIVLRRVTGRHRGMRA